MDTAASATPARLLDVPREEGCRVLEHANVGHLDGGEEEVGRILRDATDLSALSDELAAHDGSWPTRYHLARERGHIVRALELPADAHVLEIGAGCGAVTRYLGERCAVVDALEPTPARAHIARLRTRDLPGVEVFIGSLDAIPREPAYDAVVLVGVLEYVGGPEAWDERVSFLREAAARLRDGGSVVCAIENRFGAQYLAGAPEEHLGASFAGLEGYPEGGHVRTFSRAELEQLFREAGLTPSVHGVFPDYKFARLVFADSLLEGPTSTLAWSVPQLPSRSSPHARPKLASEMHLWRGLVEAGLGGHAPNSFLVLGATAGPSPLWPEDLHAAFFSAGRRAAYAIETRVCGPADAPRLRRTRLRPDVEPPSSSLVQRPEDAGWVPGVPLLDLLQRGAPDELAGRLRRWRALVEEQLQGDERGNVDLVPHNVVVDGDALRVIDHEWYDDGAAAGEVVGRGLLATALTLAERCPPQRWAGCETVGDVAALLFDLAGVDAGALDEHIRAEARRQAQMAGVPEARQLETLRATIALPLRAMPLGERELDIRRRADAATAGAQEAYRNAMARVAELDEQIVLREEALAEQARRHAAAATALQAELEDARGEIARLGAELQDLARRYEEIVGSRRWALARRLPALRRRPRP